MEIKIEKIIRSKRKTIGLQVNENGALIVRAPFQVSEEVILKVIEKHRGWIEKKKQEIEKRVKNFPEKKFTADEDFLYLGRSYKLKIVDELKEPFVFNDAFFLSKDALPFAREIFIKWYKKEAYKKIYERTSEFAKKYGFKYNKINITNAQKRWGSCSPNGNLNFSWRLIMAPLPVVDYVIIHELIHLEIKNHGKSFWAKVKNLMSDYEKYEKWLKENGYLLRI
ncbi:M48 family metallopeptidase [Thermovenabulum gondwanense]|uniref:YgjP-like metallopeptidase domain-containing protein n=1 Tax=Thermovenabulum gondwanense TaxID=520767 RepID=A0A161QAP9_9FIRM|nr:SprT family zinc-dependent metalloprotease [Thermovenabulum gondwanense]KYO65524.1 hypothetical protein ATZ99_15600 [Thermovenabulum gondwanense]